MFASEKICVEIDLEKVLPEAIPPTIDNW